MEEHQEPINEDSIIVGLTRPTMIFWVTFEAFFFNGSIVAFIFLASGNPIALLGMIPLHIIAVLVCYKDPSKFKLLFLKYGKVSKPFNRIIWKVQSYSPF